MPTYTDIEYANVGGTSLALDIYTPASGSNWPLIIYIHGGGWYSGDKVSPSFLGQVARGYAVSSINYRLTTAATPHPAQIHDCKAAVRWLRANAATYGFNPNKFCAAGFSAGGHLAALLGTTGNGVLEGTVGSNLGTSSAVQAVIDGYGPAELVSMWDSIVANPGGNGALNNVQAHLLLCSQNPVKGATPSKGSSPTKNAPPSKG